MKSNSKVSTTKKQKTPILTIKKTENHTRYHLKITTIQQQQQQSNVIHKWGLSWKGRDTVSGRPLAKEEGRNNDSK